MYLKTITSLRQVTATYGDRKLFMAIGNTSTLLDDRIADLVERDQPVTLGDLGGVDRIPDEWVGSTMFPYAAEAIVTEWGTLSNQQRTDGIRLIISAITGTESALALSDTCAAVVPSAAELGIDIALKDVLRRKTDVRSSPTQGALAATALRWLTHLAVNTDTAKPALLDLLVGVARQTEETTQFAIAAAQVAGIAYDHWREPNALDCLERLTHTDADTDAWFGLGQARLVDAFEENSKVTVMEGLQAALKCFERSTLSGEDRPDATMYSHVIRFVIKLTNGAAAETLKPHISDAETALREYMLGGRRLPEQPMWLRPRYTAENSWMTAIQCLHRAIDSVPSSHPWYQPSVVIGALSNAYRAANSLCLLRHDTEDTSTTNTFPDLIAPRLTAPFLEKTEQLALVDMWLNESDSPDAETFAELVHKAAEEHIDKGTAAARTPPPRARPLEVVHPKAPPLRDTRR